MASIASTMGNPFRPLEVPPAAASPDDPNNPANAYKKLGRDTEAGRALYNLYNPRPAAYQPRVAVAMKPPSQRVDPHAAHLAQRRAAADAKVAAKKQYRGPPPPQPKRAPGPVRSSYAGRKSAAAIAAENAVNFPNHQPSAITTPAESREVQIRRLQDKFSGEAKARASVPTRSSAAARSAASRDPNEELYESILGEINERREFLAKMNDMGQGKQHEAQINAEIKERERELKAVKALIDSSR